MENRIYKCMVCNQEGTQEELLKTSTLQMKTDGHCKVGDLIETNDQKLVLSTSPVFMVLNEDQQFMINGWNVDYTSSDGAVYECPYRLKSTDKPNVFQVIHNKLENGKE